MKQLLAILFSAALATGAFAQPASPVTGKAKTICNPLNLSYRFCLDTPSRREAADPTMVNFKDEYYLFASKTGGYWHSTDLVSWHLISSPDLPFEDYAPTVVAIKDTLYFLASTTGTSGVIYKTGNPAAGRWQVANPNFHIGNMVDPALFLDDDGRLYLYYGCSNVKPTYGVEIDTKTLKPIANPVEIIKSHRNMYGWERKGDYNQVDEAPWIEGSWMNKHNGKYYLQYAGPGTEFKSYSDGAYVSGSPLHGFSMAANSPVSYKPEGFAAGAGHSSTFMDNYGNYWHVSTMTISVKHMFERRLGLFPTFFDKEGLLHTYTGFGDFPYIIPHKKISSEAELFPGWMLLSYNKPLTVSSALPGHPASLAVNEDIRTYWSTQTGNAGEWAMIDLQTLNTVNAIQINFAEHQVKILGRDTSVYYQYLLEYSADGKKWHLLADKKNSKEDNPHDYLELTEPVKARYIKITNYHVPGGCFALSGLRVFGNAGQALPDTVSDYKVVRSEKDRTQVSLTWHKVPNAVGYNIRYGNRPGKLYHTYQVLAATALTIRSLNSGEPYYFTIDAFNESGITKGKKIVAAQ